MSSPTTTPSEIVSPRVYALILTSPRLRRQLLPQGLICSPYEILDYRATLVLHDPQGRSATFVRTQRIRFLQEGVSAILDHCWGDGVLLADYAHSAGAISESFKDEGRRHLVIMLKRPMRRGELLTFHVRRTVLLGFTREREALETTIDHPIDRMTLGVVFPGQRPCHEAALEVEDLVLGLPTRKASAGTTALETHILGAQAHTPYIIRWAW